MSLPSPSWELFPSFLCPLLTVWSRMCFLSRKRNQAFSGCGQKLLRSEEPVQPWPDGEKLLPGHYCLYDSVFCSCQSTILLFQSSRGTDVSVQWEHADSRGLERWVRVSGRAVTPPPPSPSAATGSSRSVVRLGADLERFPYIILQLDSHLPAES